MSFQPKKFNDIFEDMRKRTSVITDFETGSVARTLYESFAYEVALLYEKMQLVYLSAYVDTAEGQQLDMAVAILGIKRGLPDFAEGEVTFHRDIGNQDISIPQETLVATVDTPTTPKKVYQTGETALFRKDQTSVTVKVQAVNRGEAEVTPADTLVVLPRPIVGIKSVTNAQATLFTGKRRETDEELRSRAKNALIASGKATRLSIENALLSLPSPSVKEVKVKEDFTNAKKFGIIEVFVDCDALQDSDPKQKKAAETQLTEALDRVRAAGIFVDLKPIQLIIMDGVFRIGISADLKLSPEERNKLEQAVQAEISQYINERAMGQPLVFAQLIKSILSIQGVENLEEFELTKPDKTTTAFPSLETKLAIEEVKKFQPGCICVASENKALTINLQFKASGLEEKQQAIHDRLDQYLSHLKPGDKITVKALRDELKQVDGLTLVEDSLILIPERWCPASRRSEPEVLIRFVETPVRGDVFAYSQELKIRGALQVTLSETLKTEEKQAIAQQIRDRIGEYLKQLKSQEAVVLEQFVAIANTVNGVQDADLDPNDFQAFWGTQEQKNRVQTESGTIGIEPLEKSVLGNFCIASAAKPVPVNVTIDKLSVTLVGIQSQNEAALKEALRSTIPQAIQSFFAEQTPGQDLKFVDFKNAIANLVFGANYNVTAIRLTATSETTNNDPRQQAWTETDIPDLNIRSVEIATLKTIESIEIQSATTPSQIRAGG